MLLEIWNTLFHEHYKINENIITFPKKDVVYHLVHKFYDCWWYSISRVLGSIQRKFVPLLLREPGNFSSWQKQQDSVSVNGKKISVKGIFGNIDQAFFKYTNNQ